MRWKGIIAYITQDSKWPYPRTKRQILHVIWASALCAVVAVGGGAVLLIHNAHRPLSQDDIRHSASSLSSYTREALQLAELTKQGQSTKTYQQEYLKKLSEEVQGATESIRSRPANGPLTQAAQSLVQLGQQLRQVLDQAATQSRPTTLWQNKQTLQRIHSQLQFLEGAP